MFLDRFVLHIYIFLYYKEIMKRESKEVYDITNGQSRETRNTRHTRRIVFPVSLDCPFVIYLSSSCVPRVSGFSGLSILLIFFFYLFFTTIERIYGHRNVLTVWYFWFFITWQIVGGHYKNSHVNIRLTFTIMWAY
jgi:hypothetical protein